MLVSPFSAVHFTLSVICSHQVLTTCRILRVSEKAWKRRSQTRLGSYFIRIIWVESQEKVVW